MMEVGGLRKVYGVVKAVDNVSFIAADSTITGLLGANGAGKTTTLGMISGTIRPDAGLIRVDGAPPAPGPESRLRLGVLHEHQGLYSRLTARENIAYFARLHRLRGATLTQRVNALVARLGLDRAADRPAATLSRGEQTKVALARALVHQPRNLLLDEPTNGLDVPTVRSLRALLMELRAEGTCIIFSSHVMEQVSDICDTVVILAHGRVVATGSPTDVCHSTHMTSLEDAFMSVSNQYQGRS